MNGERVAAEHFRPDGKPKKAYRSEREADRAAYAHNRQAYKCSFCPHWHIGARRRG